MSANNPLSNIPPLGATSGMAPGGASGRFRQIDPVRVVRTHIVLLIAALVVGVILGAGSWFMLDRGMAQFTSQATLSVNAGMSRADQTGVTELSNMRDLEPKILTEVNAIRSQEILDDLLKQKPVREQTDWFKQFNADLEEARTDLEEETLRASHIRDTTLIRVSATTSNATDAQTIVSELVGVYLLQVENRAESRYDKDRVAFQRQFEDVVAQIELLEARIRGHLRDHPQSAMDQRNDAATQEVLFLNAKKSEVIELLSAAQASYQQLQQRLEAGDFAPADDEVQLIESSVAIQQLDAQLRQLRVSRETQIDSGKGESHPVIESIDSQIRHVELEREEAFDRQARSLFNAKVELGAQAVAVYQEQINTFEPRIAELRAQIEDFQRAQADYETLLRNQEALEAQRDEAQAKLRELDVLERRSGGITVELASPATTAKKSFPPHWAVMIPGVALLFTGLVTGLVFLRELLDQRVRAAADIKALNDTTLLGIIPNAGEDPSGKVPAERVVERQPTGLLAESYRQIRSAVLSKMDRRGYKTLAVAAAKPGAGTSSITQNLGASMAMSGRRVLIIDTNFRRPHQSDLLGAPESPGLIEVLRGDQRDPMQCIHTVDGLSLSLLPAGNTNGAAPELLETPAFRDLLASLESSFDIILIDAPPALLTSEAQLLCKHVDAMVLVARARTDTRGMLQRMVGQLDGQRADILGVLLNDVLAAAGGYLRQNFREFHRYHGKSNGSAAKGTKPSAVAAASNGSAPPSDRMKPDSEETVIVEALQDRDELEDLDDFDDFDEDKD
ncbi:AAA family ATPase [Phycisphaeraceae bacterium D3-23]